MTTAAEIAAFVLEQQLTTEQGMTAARRELRMRINERIERAECVHFEERLVDALGVVCFVARELRKAIDRIACIAMEANAGLELRRCTLQISGSTFTTLPVVDAAVQTQRLRDALEDVTRAAGDLAKFGERLQATDEERAAMIAEREESRKRRIEARAKVLRKEPIMDLRSKAAGMQLTGWATAGRGELATMIAAEETR